MLSDLVLGEKLFEEIGNIIELKIARVRPIEGVTTEISFTSKIRGEARYPSGENLGSGVIDATWQGTLIVEANDQFIG
jgi:hypothetical protein